VPPSRAKGALSATALRALAIADKATFRLVTARSRFARDSAH
jgi:hypothetical protein